MMVNPGWGSWGAVSGGEASEFWGGPNPYAPLTSTPLYPLSPLSCPLLPLTTGP